MVVKNDVPKCLKWKVDEETAVKLAIIKKELQKKTYNATLKHLVSFFYEKGLSKTNKEN